MPEDAVELRKRVDELRVSGSTQAQSMGGMR